MAVGKSYCTEALFESESEPEPEPEPKPSDQPKPTPTKPSNGKLLPTKPRYPLFQKLNCIMQESRRHLRSNPAWLVTAINSPSLRWVPVALPSLRSTVSLWHNSRRGTRVSVKPAPACGAILGLVYPSSVSRLQLNQLPPTALRLIRLSKRVYPRIATSSIRSHRLPPVPPSTITTSFLSIISTLGIQVLAQTASLFLLATGFVCRSPVGNHPSAHLSPLLPNLPTGSRHLRLSRIACTRTAINSTKFHQQQHVPLSETTIISPLLTSTLGIQVLEPHVRHSWLAIMSAFLSLVGSLLSALLPLRQLSRPMASKRLLQSNPR